MRRKAALLALPLRVEDLALIATFSLEHAKDKAAVVGWSCARSMAYAHVIKINN